jgi:thioredoxin-related protein
MLTPLLRGVILSVALLTCGSAAAQVTEEPGGAYLVVDRFDSTRDAARDIREAIVEANRTGRRILLDVGGGWCIWCHRLDSFFAEQKDLAGYMHEHFVVVKIFYSREYKNEAVLSRYPKIPGYPHLFVLEKDGSLLFSQDTGKLESGKGYDRTRIGAFLREWADDAGSR